MAPTVLFEAFSHSNKIFECMETNAQPGNMTRAKWIKVQTEDDIIKQVITS